ncbi:MAG: PEP-CTERM sorting domain-containing protein [Verrucomicrobiota bacterium]
MRKPDAFSQRGSKWLPFVLASLFVALTNPVSAVIVISFGSNDLTAGALNGGAVTISDSSSFVTGSLGSGITFDLTATPSNSLGGSVSLAQQAGGIGPNTGRAASAIDNNNTNVGGTNPDGDFFEVLTITISNVVGLAPSESLVMTEFGLNFANTNDPEYYSLDGSGPLPTPPNNSDGLSIVALADVTSFAVAAVNGPELGIQDSRFAFRTLTVAVIPEPSTSILLATLLAAVALRRVRPSQKASTKS